VFARDGCEAPLEAVLAEAGVGRGTLYRHFRQREHLIFAVMKSEVDRMMEFVTARRDSPEVLCEFLREHAAVGVLAVSAMQALDPEHAERCLQPLHHNVRVLYQQVIKLSIAAGVLQANFGESDLKLVMRMVIGAASQVESACERSRLISSALNLLFKGIGSWQGHGDAMMESDSD